MNLLIILDSFLLIILILITIPIIKDEFNDNFYKKQVNRTAEVVSNFGFNIGISAPVGYGKTSGANGITTILEIDIINKLNFVILEAKQLLRFWDFNEINSFLDEIIISNNYEYIDSLDIAKELMVDFKIPNYISYDFFNGRTTLNILTDYVEAYYHLNVRASYVISKTRRYSVITNEMASIYDPKQIEIFNRYREKNYNLLPFSIILEDESSDDRGYKNWQEAADTGSKEFFSKIRHIFKETVRFINMKQRSADEVKQERALKDTNIVIYEKTYQVNDNKKLFKRMKFFYSLKIFPYKLKKIYIPYILFYIKNAIKKNKVTLDDYIYSNYNHVNKYRDYEHKLLFLQYWINSLKYNVYHIRIYDNEENINSDNDKFYKEETLVFPSTYCFVYPKFEFDGIQNDLIKDTISTLESQNYFKTNSFFDKKNNTDNDERMVEEIDF